MNLFDDILEEGSFSERRFGPQEGVAGVLLAASACDGHIADEEVQALMTILSRMKLYSRLNGRAFGSMMDRLVGTMKRGGPEKLIKLSVPAVPPELYETVFVNACDIVLADGVVDPEEKEFINNLTTELEIEPEKARTFVQVMVYKNKV